MHWYLEIFAMVFRKEVTLYAMLRPEIVGKAVVISTNPTNVLGGQALGRLFCEGCDQKGYNATSPLW